MGSLPRHRLESLVANAWPPDRWGDVHVVAAVSAGADSVAMLRSLLTLKRSAGGSGSVYVAHVNHHLRGDDALADQSWLKTLCDRLEVPLEVSDVDVAAVAAVDGDGWEAAARQARYDLLLATAQRVGARFVAVAHTSDDQVETVLHHVLRGTGLSGLAGMARVRRLSPTVSLVRPLLYVSRSEVRQYLAEIGQDFREHATNIDVRYTRNRLRHELLPRLREAFNPDVDAALLRLAQQAADAQQVMSDMAAALVDRCVQVRWEDRPADGAAAAGDDSPASSVWIDCRALAGQPPPVVREVCKAAWSQAHWPLQSMGFDQWCGLSQLVLHDSESRLLNLPGNVRAQREEGAVVLRLLAASG